MTAPDAIDLTRVPAETLAVFCTNRGDYILRDQVDALHWAHARPHLIVAVDDTRPAEAPPERGVSPYGTGEHFIIPSAVVKGRTHLCGFKNFEAIRWAMDRGLAFTACLSVDDDAYPIGRGLDDWAIPEIEATAIDLLGVQDRVSYQNQHRAICAALARWIPEARNARWVEDVTPQGVFFAVIWLSSTFCRTLRQRQLLVPEGYETWATWPDVYISHVAQLLGFYTAWWGHMDRPAAPIYANHKNHMRMAPDPRILHPDFRVYHPIRYVNQYDEGLLRAHYAAVRAGRVPPPGRAAPPGRW